jgi:hypothetical protein
MCAGCVGRSIIPNVLNVYVEFTSSDMGFSSFSIDVKMEKIKFLDSNMRGKVRECKTIHVQQNIPALNV